MIFGSKTSVQSFGTLGNGFAPMSSVTISFSDLNHA